jgi:hypothetical protein
MLAGVPVVITSGYPEDWIPNESKWAVCRKGPVKNGGGHQNRRTAFNEGLTQFFTPLTGQTRYGCKIKPLQSGTIFASYPWA